MYKACIFPQTERGYLREENRKRILQKSAFGFLKNLTVPRRLKDPTINARINMYILKLLDHTKPPAKHQPTAVFTTLRLNLTG